MATQESGMVERDGGIAEAIALAVVLVLAFFLFDNLNGGALDANVPPIAIELYPDIQNVQ